MNINSTKIQVVFCYGYDIILIKSGAITMNSTISNYELVKSENINGNIVLNYKIIR